VSPLAEFVRCQRHITYFVATYCVIRHPQRGAVPFALWPWQAQLLEMLVREPLFAVLKARQLGVSELGVAFALWKARFTPGWLGLLVSRNQQYADALLERVGFMYDHLPGFLRAGSEIDGLAVGKRNTSILDLVHRTGMGLVPSRIQSLPATQGTGRGSPASWVFLDEWAHQPWQEQIVASIQPTLSTGGALFGVSSAAGAAGLACFATSFDGGPGAAGDS